MKALFFLVLLGAAIQGCTTSNSRHSDHSNVPMHAALEKSDPEFMQIQKLFTENDINSVAVLTLQQKHLSRITALVVQQALPQLQREITEALADDVSATAIKETMYVAAPFIGFPKIENALIAVNKAFTESGIALPLTEQGIREYSQRYEIGLAIQYPIYGNEIKDAFASLPVPYNEKVPVYLTELLFGDFYSRKGLDNSTRELVILVVLATLGAEKQLVSHALGNLKVGNSKEIMIGALVHCLPVIGFPAMFNAINAVRNVEADE